MIHTFHYDLHILNDSVQKMIHFKYLFTMHLIVANWKNFQQWNKQDLLVNNVEVSNHMNFIHHLLRAWRSFDERLRLSILMSYFKVLGYLLILQPKETPRHTFPIEYNNQI